MREASLNEEHIMLEKGDLCVIYTIGGRFVELWTFDFELVRAIADILREIMVFLIANHPNGDYLWRFSQVNQSITVHPVEN